MGVYDGRFNTRFNLAVRGKRIPRRRSTRGGVMLSPADLNVPPPPLKKEKQCVPTQWRN